MLTLLSIFFGPVFAKEMVEMSRRFRYYLPRILYGLALLIAIVGVYVEYSNSWRYRQGGGESIKAQVEMARTFFMAIAWVQWSAVFLFVPLFLCGVIASEREEKTLELLFTTHLTDRQIVLGKLASRVAVVLLIVLVGLPITNIVMLMGGVDPMGVWRVLAATLLGILYVSSHTIYFSVVTRSPIGALVRTYWWMAVWLIGVPLVLLLLSEAFRFRWGSQPFNIGIGAVVLTNPIGPFVVASIPEGYNDIQVILSSWPLTGGWRFLVNWFFPLAFVLPALWSVFLLWRAVRRLRGQPTAFARFFRRIPLIHPLWEWLLFGSWGRSYWFVAAERTWYGLPVRNPLWLRSRHARTYDREGVIGRIQWLCWLVAAFFFVLACVAFWNDMDDDEATLSFLAPTWAVVAILTAIFASTSLVGDRRRGFLELMLVTPMTGREVIDGTLLAVWQHMRRSYLLLWVLGLIFVVISETDLTGFLLSMMTGTLFCTLLAMIGIGCSLTARTLPGALVPTFLFPLLINAGLPFFMFFEQYAAPVLWGATAAVLFMSCIWVRFYLNAASVSTFLITVHLALIEFASCWAWGGWWGDAEARRGREHPVPASIHSAFLTIIPLAKEFDRSFRGRVEWEPTYLCYLTAVIMSIVFARWWLIHNFDRILGRDAKPGRAPKQLKPKAEAAVAHAS